MQDLMENIGVRLAAKVKHMAPHPDPLKNKRFKMFLLKGQKWGYQGLGRTSADGADVCLNVGDG